MAGYSGKILENSGIKIWDKLKNLFKGEKRIRS